MPDAWRFSAAVGSEGARELVAVARYAVSQSLGRLPAPMINVRGLGSVVEAGRRWALDERGTRTSCEVYFCSLGNAGGGRAKRAVPPSRRQLLVRKVPGLRAFGLLLFDGPRRMLGALVVEVGEGRADWCTVMAELLVFYRSCRQTTAVNIRNARLANCDRSRSCVTDPGLVDGLTGDGGPCESLVRVLLFCCRGGSAACVLAGGGMRRRCPRA